MKSPSLEMVRLKWESEGRQFFWYQMSLIQVCCLTTLWTQLAYRFNWRTARPLGASPPPGCDEPTSRFRQVGMHLVLPQALTIPSPFQSRKGLVFYKSCIFLCKAELNFYPVLGSNQTRSRYGGCRMVPSSVLSWNCSNFRSSPILTSWFIITKRAL